MEATTERQLVRDLRDGRREACAQLVRAHYKSIYRLLVHLTREVHLAEDLTQETFAAAWASIGTFKGRASLGTWLHRIAYAKWIDSGRRSQRRAKWVAQWVRGRPEPAQTAGPLDHLLQDERARQICGAIHGLQQQDQAVIVLHYMQGLSFRQMATVLAEPPGTVKWRVSQALKRLKASLNGRI